MKIHKIFDILVSFGDAHPVDYNPVIQKVHFGLWNQPPHAIYEETTLNVTVGNRRIEMSRNEFKKLMMTVSIYLMFHSRSL